jgi:DNA-directed RNA polymerase subunit RPC12/RpoP
MILAEEQRPAAAASNSRPQASDTQTVPAVPTLSVELIEDTSGKTPPAPLAERVSCLECGKDITNRARLQTCPHCGSPFCSAMCYREHQQHAHARPAKARRYVECEFCGSTARPYRHTEISTAGWTTFVLLLIFFFPLFWIGLLMTETQVKCTDCGARLA